MDFDALVSVRVKSESFRVPPSPVVALRLRQLVKDERATVAALAAVVKQDQALTALVLRLANSALYRRATEVVSVASAIVIIGRRPIADLALAQGLYDVAVTSGPLLSLRRRAWRESLVSAQVAQWVAEDRGLDGDEAFAAALLHDLGKVPMISLLEDLLKQHPDADTRSEEGWWGLIESFHVETGRALAQGWRLPERIRQIIASHHDTSAHDPLLEVVRIADEVVALLDGEPGLEPDRLGTIAALSTEQCTKLAGLLPQLPVYLDAFRDDAKPDDSEVIDYELRLPPQLAVDLQLTLHIGGLVTDTQVEALDECSLVVTHALRPGQLVRVGTPGFSFHAQVRAASIGAAELSPWALDRTQQQQWREFVSQSRHKLTAA